MLYLFILILFHKLQVDSITVCLLNDDILDVSMNRLGDFLHDAVRTKETSSFLLTFVFLSNFSCFFAGAKLQFYIIDDLSYQLFFFVFEFVIPSSLTCFLAFDVQYSTLPLLLETHFSGTKFKYALPSPTIVTISSNDTHLVLAAPLQFGG